MELLTTRSGRYVLTVRVRAATSLTRHHVPDRNTQPSYIIQSVKSVHSRISQASTGSILPYYLTTGLRPVQKGIRRKIDTSYHAYFQDVLAPDVFAPVPKGGDGSLWWSQCKRRLGWHPVNEGLDKQENFWPGIRFGCVMAMAEGVGPKQEADARILCGELHLIRFNGLPEDLPRGQSRD